MPSKIKTWIKRFRKSFSQMPENYEELLMILKRAEERHIISPETVSMMERILQVSRMQVREIMVPRAQMTIVHKDDSLHDLLPVVKESGHSRFPVVDRITKDVVGILLAKDLLNGNHNDEDFEVTRIMRSAFFTTQSKRLDILLREFRINRNHIAMVIDEYGHVAGLVTIEDVLEQIVGDIADEYDIDKVDAHIKKLDDGTFIVQASTIISEFNEYFHSDFDDDTFDTIGGIILKHFGHLPKRGEIINIKKLNFKVLHSDHRRIYLIEVKAKE